MQEAQTGFQAYVRKVVTKLSALDCETGSLNQSCVCTETVGEQSVIIIPF